MSRGVHLIRDRDVLLSGVVDSGILTDLMAERAGDPVRPGDIYLCRIERMARNSGSAYVDLGLGQPAFLSDAGSNVSAELLVQVVRTAGAGKSIEVTRDIAVPGFWMVYRPFGAGVAVSRKLDPDLVQTLRPAPPGGWILRAAAMGSSRVQIAEEASRLERIWKTISESADGATAPARVHQGPDAAARLILDTPGVVEIRVEDADLRKALSAWIEATAPDMSDLVLGSPMDLREELPALLEPEVRLPRDGSIMIESTTALTAVDVNAGAASDVVQVNREAARAVARQLRLRNIGGIVVVDFISMKRRDARNAVVDLFRGLLDEDPAHIRPARGLSGLGLFELARERRGSALADVMAGR